MNEGTNWVAVGIEVHDRPCAFDSDGVRCGDTPNRICAVEYPYGDEYGKRVNARLFAAAPAMYSALELALDALNKMTTDEFANGADKPVREAIAAALATARGESK